MNPKAKTIAILHPIMIIGGAERLIIDLSLSLKASSHKVALFTSSLNPKCAFKEVLDGTLDIETIGNSIPNLILNRFQLLLSIFKMFILTLYVLFFKPKYDLYIVDTNCYVMPLFKLFRRKTVFYCHFPDKLLADQKSGFLFRIYRFFMGIIEEFCLFFCDQIWVNSEFTKTKFYESFKFLGHKNREIKTVYPCINFSYLNDTNKDNASEKIPNLPDRYFISLNRIEKKKKIEIAIYAFSLFKNMGGKKKDCKLIIAGGFESGNSANQEYLDYLKQVTFKLNLENEIQFFLNVSNSMRLALLKGTIAVLYTPPNEHFGIVPIEAMYLEKPVICQNNGGPVESVGKDCGFLLEDKDALWAEKMELLFGNDSLVKKMGTEGKNNVEARFSFESFRKLVNQNVAKI